MHILMIASAESLWTKKYIENILLPSGHTVTILSEKCCVFKDFYDTHGIKVVTLAPLPQLARRMYTSDANTHVSFKRQIYVAAKHIMPTWLKKYIRTSRMRHTLIKVTKGMQLPDVIHMHYIVPDMEETFSYIWKKFSGKIIMTYWGSDIFRLTDRQYNQNLLIKADAITFMSKELKIKFQNIYGNKFNSKLHIIDFGVSGYDVLNTINRNNVSRESNRQHFSIPKNKICIMAGYNASPGQQHLQIIEAVGKLPDALRRKIHLLLQYSYNYTESNKYYASIQEVLKHSNFSWSIIDKFMDDYECAQLRSIVDIFIHAQITDALSASMLEYIYAGALVINGSWLHYPELDSRGIFYLKFDTFEELTSLLENVLSTDGWPSFDPFINRTALHKMNSWNAVKQNWLQIYS